MTSSKNIFRPAVFQAYLVGLVVVLRVEFEDLLLLGVLPCRQKLVQLGLFSPLLSTDEPITRQVNNQSSLHALLAGGRVLFEGRGGGLGGVLHCLGSSKVELARTQEAQL